MKIIFTIFMVFSFGFSLELKKEEVAILAVDKDKIVIDKGRLIVGQSGVVKHHFNFEKSSILAYGFVISSNEQNSTVSLQDREVLPQDALPKTNLKPTKNDKFVLNHLYNASLMIVPNFSAKQKVKELYSKHFFLNSDIFAAYLKIEETPVPTKEIIQKFALQNELGTIVIFSQNKIYLVDSISFKIIKVDDVKVDDNKTMSPFLTNVQNIKKGVLDFTSLEDIKDYHKYYNNLLGIKNGN